MNKDQIVNELRKDHIVFSEKAVYSLLVFDVLGDREKPIGFIYEIEKNPCLKGSIHQVTEDQKVRISKRAYD